MRLLFDVQFIAHLLAQFGQQLLQEFFRNPKIGFYQFFEQGAGQWYDAVFFCHGNDSEGSGKCKPHSRCYFPGAKVVLGGFSQGAMLACDTALREGPKLAGLVVLSGTLVAEAEWAALFPTLRGTPVFQSHGTFDPLLPFQAAAMLRDLISFGDSERAP